MFAESVLHDLTASEAAARIADGMLRSDDLVRACLDRIEAREPEVAAWQHIEPEVALRKARVCDQERSRRQVLGVLHGVPVAIKDVFDTADMPTTYGSTIYQGHCPTRDAATVALLRRAGAVIMGKTVTTEFAARYPGKTANPHDRTRTPGGSSSGSAASVADRMVPLATGTQTVGSTIRPAAYCGIYGYKPTFGLLSFVGVRHLSATFDTVGLFARSLDDLELFRTALLALDKHISVGPLSQPPRIAFCRTPMWDKADDATRSLIEGAAHALADAGALVEDAALAEDLASAEDIIWSIVYFQMARDLTEEYEWHRDGLSAWARDRIEAARKVPVAHYLDLLAEVERLRGLARDQLAGVDVVLTPAASAEAPKGLSDTGPPTFQSIWQLLQMPAITLPAFTGPMGMPIGLQLVGQVRADDSLFAAARWVESRLMRDRIVG